MHDRHAVRLCFRPDIATGPRHREPGRNRASGTRARSSSHRPGPLDRPRVHRPLPRDPPCAQASPPYLLPMTLQLVDPFARAISYLRVSVTDRCDFRCVYCMSENMTFLPKADLLTLEELDRLCSAFVAHRRPRSSASPAASRWCAGAHDLLPRHVPPPRDRRAQGTHAHHQRQPARQLRRRPLPTAACAGSTSPSTRSTRRNSPQITRWGRLPRCSTGIDAAAGRRPQGQDQRRRAQGLQRGRTLHASSTGARAAGHRPHLHRGHADGRASAARTASTSTGRCKTSAPASPSASPSPTSPNAPAAPPATSA